ncbi:hypothetical protein J7E49_06690 [Variovorax paradoxus]|nr:hypothetical protein [Variovorax paradoxus]
MISLIHELLQCKHGDPSRGRSGVGRWLTVNVPAELWARIEAVAGEPQPRESDLLDTSTADPVDLEALAERFTTSHTLRGGPPFERIPTLVRAAHRAGRMSMRVEVTTITDKIREIRP